MPFDTAGAIINDAAEHLGLQRVPDPYGSTDPNFIQLRVMLKSLGRDLCRLRTWVDLRKEYTFTTTGGVSEYATPFDYLSLMGDTPWDRTNRQEVLGPVTPQGWQTVKAAYGVFTQQILYKVQRNTIVLHTGADTPAGLTIAFEYRSAFWVTPNGQSSPILSEPTAQLDAIWFDSQMMVHGLRMHWARAKGFDSTAAEQDFQAAFNSATGNEMPGRTLRLDGPRDEPLLGELNIPITGIGL